MSICSACGDKITRNVIAACDFGATTIIVHDAGWHKKLPNGVELVYETDTIRVSKHLLGEFQWHYRVDIKDQSPQGAQ